MCRFWPSHRQDVAHRTFQQLATSSFSVSFLDFMGVPKIHMQERFILHSALSLSLLLSCHQKSPKREHKMRSRVQEHEELAW